MKSRSGQRRSLSKAAGDGRALSGTKNSGKLKLVGDIMQRKVHYCFADQPIEEARIIMQENDLEFLSVVDDKLRIIGKVDLP
jgi:CBS domain-containing protein